MTVEVETLEGLGIEEEVKLRKELDRVALSNSSWLKFFGEDLPRRWERERQCGSCWKR